MKLKLVFNSLKSDRRELEVSPWLCLGLALLLTLAIYGALWPVQKSYLGILLYERGFTQHLVILFASFVLAFLALKALKIQREFKALTQDWLPQGLTLIPPEDSTALTLQHNLSKETNVLARRCSRVLGAYLYSQERPVATEFALEDAAFYQNSSEASYALPRILIWAIPLLGFIGTVLGISAAVNGFSGFLEQSSDIDQIKEGIGTVTSGLAIAFDTTLLALLFSVIAMIPLSLVERWELRLLLAMDIYINDKVLPRFQGTHRPEQIRQWVDEAVKRSLPGPEALIQPAQHYAEQAAQALAQGFQTEIATVQGLVTTLITNLEQTNTTIRDGNIGLNQQLEQTAQALETRVGQLVEQTAQINEVARLQVALAETLRTLKEKETLEGVLARLETCLTQLQPSLSQLSKPRRLTWVETLEEGPEA
jgi:biopolymer transport protein ExbB/TolQ